MFFSGPQIIGCAARKIFSLHKILVMVFQYSHCQDTGTPGRHAVNGAIQFLLINTGKGLSTLKEHTKSKPHVNQNQE